MIVNYCLSTLPTFVYIYIQIVLEGIQMKITELNNSYPNKSTTSLTTRVDIDVAEKVKQLAIENNSCISHVISYFIKEGLKKVGDSR